MSIIVTHLNPDLDAICSVWLIKKFLPGWEDAEVKFVPAGLNKNNMEHGTRNMEKNINSQLTTHNSQLTSSKSQVQSSTSQVISSKSQVPSELWVDTGFGELDHHQNNDSTCAADLTWKYIKKNINETDLNEKKRIKNELERKAVVRVVNVVLRIDHAAEDITMPNAADDFFAFLFNERQILRGIRSLYRGQSEKHLEYGMQTLDAILETMKIKMEAENIINNGIKFQTKWGKGIGAETANEMYMHLGQEKGFKVVVAKDPKKGHIRIHGLPKQGIDFTRAYETYKKMDSEATWYLHPSLSLLLNGSSANPGMKPTKLTLGEIIEVLERK